MKFFIHDLKDIIIKNRIGIKATSLLNSFFYLNSRLACVV